GARGGGAAVTGGVAHAVTGHGVDVPGGHLLPVEVTRAGRDHPHAVVAMVGDHQVAVAVHGHGPGAVELGLGRGAAVAGEASGAVAGDGVDVAGGHLPAVEGTGAGRDHSNGAGTRVRDHQVARLV